MQCLLLPLVFSFVFIVSVVVAPPSVNRKEKAQEDAEYNIEGLAHDAAQLHEYYRYVKKVMHIMEEDPEYVKRGEQEATDEQIKEGFLIKGLMAVLKSDTVERLNRLKAEEIEHQKQLLADNKEHMKKKENNEWNPIHHDEKDQTTFTQDDLDKLMNKFNLLQEAADVKRKAKFKKHEMKKELEFRKELKNMTEEKRAEAQKLHDEEKHKPHEKMHAPGHKAQLEEVWEEQDGLDKESFDLKTFFNLHDKNSDGQLDTFELDTMFLSDLDKFYNESDPDMDPLEREEEMQRMREAAMEDMDVNNDGLVSFKEYMDDAERQDFEEDPEWKPLAETDQFSEDELDHYEEEEEEEEDGEDVDDQVAGEGDVHVEGGDDPPPDVVV